MFRKGEMLRKKLSVVFIILLCLTVPLFAQGNRGAITGVITDAAGAVIPNAEVTAIQIDTGTAFKTVSTGVGVYRIPYVPAGTYRVSVTQPGFKKAVVEPVVVALAAVVTANLQMQVGESVDSITVNAESTHLESSSSEIGYAVSTEDLHEWPVNSNDDGQRQIQSFIFSSLPGSTGDSYMGSVNGGPTGTHEVYIEGISVGRADLGASTAEFEPTVDAVSEFRLQTGGLNASYGGGLTAVANFNIKSGGNQVHGTAFDYIVNEAFNANGFDNNALGITKKSPYKQNSFGATFGGPIFIPKVYNGKNKTFFFFSYEGARRRTGAVTGHRTMPTADFKAGDFSQLLNPDFNPVAMTKVGDDAAGNAAYAGVIYDPNSTITIGDKQVRSPFPGNRIMSDRISKVSSAILSLAPTPDPIFGSLTNNILGVSSQPIFNLNTYAGKFDQNISDKHRLAFFMNSSDRVVYKGVSAYQPIPGTASGPFALQDVHGTMIRVGEDWTIGPSLLNHVAFGLNRLNNDNSSLTLGGNWPSKIGLTGVAETTFPSITFSGNTTQGGTIATMGRNNAGAEPNGSYIVANDTTWIHGAHAVKFGIEIRKYFYNQDFRGGTSGTFNFGPGATASPEFLADTGFSYASFLLGNVNSSRLTVGGFRPESRVWNPAFYVADDWKASRKLTVNLGLRWDIAGGVFETQNRTSAFDPNMPNPDAGNYPGALAFLSDLNRKSFQNTYYGGLGPRLGLAYQISERLVLRAGYGLMYTPPIANSWGFATVDGYLGSNPKNANPNGAPVFNWDNGYPAYTKTLPNKSAGFDNGGSIQYQAADSAKQSYAQNYTFGLQYLVSKDTTLQASYVGNKGSRLNAGNFANMNQLDPKYLALGNALLDPITAHPEIPVPYAGFTEMWGDGASVGQALLPYPQYGGGGVTNQFPHFGSSDYNSLQVVASQKVTKGLGFLISYAYQKTLSDVDGAIYYGSTSQNVYNRKLERSVANFDHTQQLRLTWIGELPFGKGRTFLNHGGILNQIVGGWTVTANQTYQSGNPLTIASSLSGGTYLYNGGIRADTVTGQPLTVPMNGVFDYASGGSIGYLNPAAFVDPPSTTQGVISRMGTSPRYFGNLRGPYSATENIGMFKRFPFGEGKHVEFRADAFNAFNRTGFADPDTTVGSPTFGSITDVQQGPRNVQLSLRVTF
jgi:hypothetical protein